MRTHTNEFKEELKVFGRQIKGKITYYPSYDLVSESDDNILTEADLQIISEQANYDEPIEISEEDIFSISIIKNGDLLQSLMKEFDFETKIELNIGSVVNPQFALLVNENYEYLNYGNYIINSKEFNMDTETWSYVCYDKMLFSMVKYRGLSNVQYPITIKQFINNLCNKVGLEFQDSQFVNQNQLIYEDLYKNRDVTYRDIFDEISKIVAGNLLINDSDKLEVGYPNKASYSDNASGSDISIEAVEEPISDVKLQGDTQQNTLEGTNLIKFPNIAETTVNGITYSIQDDVISLNGTATDNIRYIYASNFAFDGEGDYRITLLTISGNYTHGVLGISSRNEDKTQQIVWQQVADGGKTNKKTYTTSNITAIKNIGMYINSGTVINNLKFKFMFTKGDNIPTTYENMSSPTPDYPQDIEVVTGEQNIQIVGKNLIEPKLPTTTRNGITITNNGDGSWTLDGTATSNADFRIDQSTPNGHDNLKTYNGTYTLSCNELINGIELVIMQNNTWNIIARMINSNIPVTFTTDKDNCFIYVFVSSGTTLNNLTIYPQLEKGSQATSYEPYQSQNYPINLGNIELCKIRDYQDYIYNQNGDWYLHKEINKVILNGGSNETYTYQNNHRFWLRRSYWTDETVPKNTTPTSQTFGIYCNRFKEQSANGTWNGIEGISYDGNNIVDLPIGGTLNIACNSVATNETNFKTWLSSNNLIVYYILQNQQDIQITDTTLIQQLDNLKNATLYNGVNNISVDGNLPSILNLDYISEYESINEDYLKDTNVRMSEKIGVINSVAILDTDNDLQYVAEDTQSIKENEMTRVTITDNLIAMNGETQEIADNILNKLNGLYYYANDLQTTGVCYYDFLDMFNVEARGNIYQCLLLNNEITITQGIEEHIFTERFEEVETSSNEYTTSVISNKAVQFKINQQEGRIESKVEKDGVISAINQSAEEIQINANKLSFEGATINMTADNVKIKGKNLDIDSEGVITLTDNSAENVLNGETQEVAYIVSSQATATPSGTNVDLLLTNKVIAGGVVTTANASYEYDGTITSYTTGITTATYAQPRITLYGQSDDYDASSSVGSYDSLDIGLNSGISSTKISNGVTSNPLTITSAGRITCVSVTQTSKEENKKNFEKLFNAKEILNATDIYKYNMIDEEDGTKKHIGFIIGEDYNYSKDITSVENNGVDIYSMVSVLWQVVKEQQEEINELKEMINNGKY